jgi:hypothetical protein
MGGDDGLNPADRLNGSITAIESVGRRGLMMGGHTVCYCNLQRFTDVRRSS